VSLFPFFTLGCAIAYYIFNTFTWNQEIYDKMLVPSFGLVLLGSVSLIEARSVFQINHVHGMRAHKRQNNDLTATVLAADAIQTGSFSDGSNATGSAAGQSKSETSTNNFINNCAGKTLTNGLQVTTGSCNGIGMLYP